jgi:hypothetical protein
MAKQTDRRRWRFRPLLRPKLALLLVGVCFDNLFVVQYQFVVQHQFVTVGQTVNPAIFVEFMKKIWDDVR